MIKYIVILLCMVSLFCSCEQETIVKYTFGNKTIVRINKGYSAKFYAFVIDEKTKTLLKDSIWIDCYHWRDGYNFDVFMDSESNKIEIGLDIGRLNFSNDSLIFFENNNENNSYPERKKKYLKSNSKTVFRVATDPEYERSVNNELYHSKVKVVDSVGVWISGK
jgi:hypothetical protein